MKKRTHEIKLRLDDEELQRLNETVAKTIFNRESFLRVMLEGFTIQEYSKSYTEFSITMRRIGTQQNLLNWNKSLSPEGRADLKQLARELWDTLMQLNRVYMPCYKETERRRYE